jgi:transketolase C-terminal domain/subunit
MMLKRIGIPDFFIEQGSLDRLRAAYGLDEDGICKTALAFIKEPLFAS